MPFFLYHMLTRFMHNVYDLIFIGSSVLQVAPVHSFPTQYLSMKSLNVYNITTVMSRK